MRTTPGDADALIRMLYDIAEDPDAPVATRLSAIKEILDRTVGKGPLADDPNRTAGEIVFRMEEPPATG